MNRLRAYRAIEGDNQAELAEKLSMSPQMVSAVESGRKTFTGDLTKLGYAPTRFDTPTMSDPLHRHRASTTAAAKNRAQKLLRLAGEVFKELRDKTERAPYLALERLPAPMTTDEWEDAAIDVRALLQHEERGPIRNLTSAAERAGICIVPMPRLRGIDGLSAWVDDVAVIGLAPNVPRRPVPILTRARDRSPDVSQAEVRHDRERSQPVCRRSAVPPSRVRRRDAGLSAVESLHRVEEVLGHGRVGHQLPRSRSRARR